MRLRIEVEKSLKIKKGKTSPPVQFRLFNMDTFLPVDLTGAEIRFFMEGPEGGADIKKLEGKGDVVVSPLTGIGKYEWKPGDTDTPGNYTAAFEITIRDGMKIRVPEGADYMRIEIED